MKLKIPRLEMHVAHDCNLACESCSHLSNMGFTGMVSPEEAERQMALWSYRLDPETFAITGGEPTINPKLVDIVEKAIPHFPFIEVTTNGWFLKNHTELGRALAKAHKWARLCISVHGSNKLPTEALEMAQRWKDDYHIGIEVRPFSPPKGDNTWTRRYEGYGPSMRPFRHGDTELSYSICPAKHCIQLHQGKLWKCPLIAYLPMAVEKYPEIKPFWETQLAYEPLDSKATDSELRDFVEQRSQDCCEGCPSSKQLLRLP